MYKNIRVELEKYPPIHNDVAKVMFEWCQKYGLEGREKSRFIDGVKLGVALANKAETVSDSEDECIEKLYMQWEHSEDEYMYDRICSGQSAHDPTVSMALKVFKAGYIACKNNK